MGYWHNLLGDKTIIVKKADKGTTSVIMSREQKIKEGQILLNDLDNYRPLDKPMADETAKKIKKNNDVYAHRRPHWRNDSKMALPNTKST